MNINIEEMKKNISRMDHFFHAEIKEVNEDQRTIEGWASTEDIDRINDVVLASAFKKTLKDYLKNPVLTLMHDITSIPGHIQETEIIDGEKEKKKGLKVKAYIDSTEEILWRKIKEKSLRAFSFGFRTKKWHTEEREIAGAKAEIRVIEDLELLEIAIVSIPMNKNALFTAVKGWENGKALDLTCESGCKNCGACLDNYSKSLMEQRETYEAEMEAEKERKVWEETENEIRYRIKNPDLFKEGSFRRITLQRQKPRVFGIIGRLKGESKTTLQALRFPKGDDWTMSAAKKWVKDHPDIAKMLNLEGPESEKLMGLVCNLAALNETIIKWSYDPRKNSYEYIVTESEPENGCTAKIITMSVGENDAVTLSETDGIYQEEEKVGQSISSRNKKRLNDILDKISSAADALKGAAGELKEFMAEHENAKPDNSDNTAEPDKAGPNLEVKEKKDQIRITDISYLIDDTKKEEKILFDITDYMQGLSAKPN